MGPATLSSSQLAAFQSASSDFALSLYRLARADAGNAANLFFSPASISLALGMVHAGARGRTKTQIKRHLLGSVSDSSANRAYSWLMESLNREPKKYQLHTANRIYVQEDMAMESEFAETVAACFDSSAVLRNFKTNAEAVRLEVNGWVEDKTNEKIKDLIPRGVVDSATRMILVNAIYFKAEWLRPFHERGGTTYDGRFFPLAAPNSPQTVKMMHREIRALYYEEPDVQVLGLPYKDNELTMFIILPRERTGLGALEEGLTTRRLAELTSGVRERTVDVTIPKFKLTQNLPLKKLLRRMGMSDMFTDQADLSGINGRRDLFVSDALHKAFIEVNEKGTEAAAATAVIMTFKSASIRRDPIRFRADHPFLFFIQHDDTDSVLFYGSLSNIPA
jgi:serpin B